MAARKLKQLTLICCLVHARRKFDEAKKTHPELAEVALELFNRIYKIEQRCRDEGLSWDDITQVR